MFLQPDGTFVVQLLNFAIFFALLNVVFMRPVSRAIAKRREYINSLTNDYDRYQAQANELLTQAKAIRAAARREAEATMAKGRAEATNESAALSTSYGQQVEKAVQEAHRTVAAELEAARADGARIAGDLAALMVKRTLTESAP